MADNNKKKWFTLGAVAIALLLIPRRSSQKIDVDLADNVESNHLKTHPTTHLENNKKNTY